MFVENVYLSVRDVAELTKRSEYTVREWCRKGKLNANKPGGRDYVIKHEDFEAFMECGVKKDA